MTKDTSPENLRKFLESDDPAMVLMGIAMAKGAGVKVTLKDLERFLESDVEMKTSVMVADEAGVGDELMKRLCASLFPNWGVNWAEVEEGEEEAEETGEPFDKWDYCEEYAEEISEYVCGVAFGLGNIGDKRAVKPLIELLKGEITKTVYQNVSEFFDEFRYGNYAPSIAAAAGALGEIGDARAVEPLIEALDVGGWDGDDERQVSEVVAEALGKIGDVRAVEPLIGVLEDEDEDVCNAAKEALKKLGHKVE